MNGALNVLPCPFCGGEDIRVFPHIDGTTVGFSQVLCMGCAASASGGNGDDGTRAVAQWNRRAACKCRPSGWFHDGHGNDLMTIRVPDCPVHGAPSPSTRPADPPDATVWDLEADLRDEAPEPSTPHRGED